MNPAELYKNEANVSQGGDGNWYYYPDKFRSKLIFLIVSLAIVILGGILGWAPAVRYLFGERATARIARIVRNDPDREAEVIRYRKDIPEGDHLTRFTYITTIEKKDGSSQELTLAVGSLRSAYANINDEVEVVYFADEDHAYALREHRTWSFSIGFLFVGIVLTACAIPTLFAVGKPILIDPEAAEPAVGTAATKP
jgi:hypothetical protein